MSATLGVSIQIPAGIYPMYVEHTRQNAHRELAGRARQQGMNFDGPIRVVAELPMRFHDTGNIDEYGHQERTTVPCDAEDADVYQLVFEATVVPAYPTAERP